MSELQKTIARLEEWIEYWEPHHVPEFIADLRVLMVNLRKRDAQIQRALQVLQRAQRYDADPHGDYYQGEGMVRSEHGDYVDISDVLAAIDILQEGQQ